MLLSQIKDHFDHRAEKYESSARWVKDERIFTIVKDLSCVKAAYRVLDVACGTGIIAGLFFKKAKRVIGLDVTEAMFTQALLKLDDIVNAQSELLPFRDSVFDLVTCRQGLQFMDAAAAVAQMYRVCKQGGKIILIQLAAFGQEDKEYAFKIQMARQPVRENCFLEEDLVNLLREAGCKKIKSQPFYSQESVNEWIDNGALPPERQLEIKKLYYAAPASFKKIHELQFLGHDVIDTMKIAIVCGYKN
ncbi:MAG: methyltransferase domain-containing protein [Candidatus Omnitrophota bacterium]